MRDYGRPKSTPAPLTTTTDASGVATFTLPPGRWRTYDGSIAQVVAASGGFVPVVRAEPVSADVWARGGTVTVAVYASASGGILVGGNYQGLTPAGGGITVRLLPLGI